jgi:hypothetical protein
VRYLGGLFCGTCGRARASAADKASWLVVVVGGALALVKCPTCEGAER